MIILPDPGWQRAWPANAGLAAYHWHLQYPDFCRGFRIPFDLLPTYKEAITLVLSIIITAPNNLMLTNPAVSTAAISKLLISALWRLPISFTSHIRRWSAHRIEKLVTPLRKRYFPHRLRLPVSSSCSGGDPSWPLCIDSQTNALFAIYCSLVVTGLLSVVCVYFMTIRLARLIQ